MGTAKETNNMLSDTSKHIYSNTRKYDEKAIPSSPPTISPTESTHTSSQSDTSRIQLINLAPLKHSKSWPASFSENALGCAIDYRDMAKYGIRPNSALCRNVVQPPASKIENHRIKKNWISSNISTLSIQEDDEDDLYPPSLPEVQKRFELEMEQRVL